MADNTLAGRPIEGDRSWFSDKRVVEQWDESKFVELLDAVLDLPSVRAVRWEGSTPYFNDGDPCIFSIYGAQVQTDESAANEVDEDEDYWEDDGRWIDTYDIRPKGEWVGTYGVDRKFVAEPGQDTTLYDALEEFSSALNKGHFDNLVISAFGDPARVVATKGGFVTETFEHD